MSILQSYQAYAPDYTIHYDAHDELYKARLLCRGGEYLLEAPTHNMLMHEIEETIYQDSRELLREISQDKKPSRSVGGSSSSSPSQEQEIEQQPHQSTSWFSKEKKTHSWWGGKKKKRSKRKRFAIIFCGVLLVAGSKRALKKKLIRARNKRTGIIMNHMRKHAKEHDRIANKWRTRTKRSKDILAQKRNNALDSWEQRLSTTGREMGIEKRLDSIKKGLGARRERAVSFEL